MTPQMTAMSPSRDGARARRRSRRNSQSHPAQGRGAVAALASGVGEMARQGKAKLGRKGEEGKARRRNKENKGRKGEEGKARQGKRKSKKWRYCECGDYRVKTTARLRGCLVCTPVSRVLRSSLYFAS